MPTRNQFDTEEEWLAHLRLWFAGQALAGIIFGERDPHASAWDARVWAEYAYKTADAMLAERTK